MTDEKMLEALDAAEASLQKFWNGKKIPRIRSMDAVLPWNRSMHIGWMIWMVREFIDGDRRDKAQRWLGFIQGALWAMCIMTVENAKRANMPAEAVFDKDSI